MDPNRLVITLGAGDPRDTLTSSQLSLLELDLTPGQLGLVEKLAYYFEALGGRDWENLASALGYRLPGVEANLIRIRQGHIDHIDRAYPHMREKLLVVFSKFLANCSRLEIEVDLPRHVASILLSRQVFGYPYTSLAEEVLTMYN